MRYVSVIMTVILMSTFSIWPNTNSARTRTNPGQCGSPDFANKLFFVENGKQLVIMLIIIMSSTELCLVKYFHYLGDGD